MHDAPKLWWNHDSSIHSGDVHDVLFPHVKNVENGQHEIHRMNLFNAKLYCGRELMAMDWNSPTKTYHHGPIGMQFENLVASNVDTVAAMLGRHKPKAVPVVRDASFSIERNARLLDKILWAEANHQDLYTKMQRAFLDSLWAQIGALKIDIDGDEIYTERVMPDEIIVDQRECIGGYEPLQIHQRKLMSKIQLASMYPEHEAEIMGIKNKMGWTDARKPTDGHLIVIESWFKGLSGQPGRHVICTESLTLVDETYTRSRFPFIFLRWTLLPTGFYGKSLVEELTPYQLRHNELNRVIKLAQDLMCVPRILVEGSSKIVKTHLDNSIARLLHYRGTPPIPLNWKAGVDELYAERDRNRAAASEYVGVSQSLANANPDPGNRLDSSLAMQEKFFRENERQAPKSQRLENAYLEAFDHYIELNTILGKRGKSRKLKWRDKTAVDMVCWKDVDLDRDKYVLDLQAASVTSMTPAARTDKIETWMQQGRISPQQANGLSGNPDLEEEESLMAVSSDDSKAVVAELDNGDFPQPDPLSDLSYQVPFVHKWYLKRKRQKDVPPEILQNYRDWIVEAQALLEGEQQMVTQQQMAQPNITPEGQILPSVATTAQGTPVDSLM